MSATDLLAQDAAARIRALEHESFIVEAPAGAGKTELLSQRCLKLLASVEAPEEVVAITFTNKAAAEMRDRILSRLAAAATTDTGPPPEPHLRTSWELARAVLARDAACGWGILAHPGRLRVTTIDALCASLARQMPYLSRFGAAPAVVTDAQAHYEQAARRTLELLEGEGEAAATLAEALEYHDNDAGALERLLTEMLARRDQWLQHAHRASGEAARAEAEAGLRRLIAGDLRAVADFIDPRLQSLLMPAARFAAALWDKVAALADWQHPLCGEAGELPQWQALVTLLTVDSKTKPGFRAQVTVSQGFPAKDPQGKELGGVLLACIEDLRQQSGALEALLALKKLPDPDLGDDWPLVECFARLLKLAAAQLWLVFQEAGEVDFTEIAFQSRQALGDDEAPTDLALALDYRIRHLLVDEFQDTSPSQVDLLARLTRGWQADDGRTLFLVGDPMQSIYRFRKAEVGLFLRVQAAGIGDIRLTPLRLYRNNRSCPGVVDWVNAIFPQVFAPQSDVFAGAVRYNPCVASKVAEATAAVHFHALPDDGSARARQAEAERILAIIAETRRTRPDARIAVLVRGREHLTPLVAEIRRQQGSLRYMAVEIEALSGRQCIQDLISLTRALLHRGDRVHWLAILRAPWCGLTLADLHALAGGGTNTTIWQAMQADNPRLERLSADGAVRLAHCRAILGEALAWEGRLHPRRWIEGVWRLLDGPACLANAGELEDCAAFFQLLDQLVAEGKLTPEALEERVDKLFALPDAQADERLQFMTIHKSKGLEFDTVIVPGLDRAPSSSGHPLLVWGELPVEEGGDALLVAPRRRGKRDDGPTPFSYLCDWEATRRAHEEERLLYVAATRAERCLHWLGVAKYKQGEGASKPGRGALLRLLWQPVAAAAFADLPGVPTNEAVAPVPDTPFIPDLVRLAEMKLPVAYGDVAATEGAVMTGKNELAPALINLDASIGTLVHRCLEKFALDGMDVWSAERLTAMQGRFQRWLRQQGHTADEAEKGARRTEELLRRCLDSQTLCWLLQARPEAAAELALSSRDGENVSQHIIDLTFVDHGVRWIVDYKTAQMEKAGADFLRVKVEDYREQLERYAGLFAEEGLPIKLAIYFVAIDQLVELTPV